jgi:hypothetical protein
LENFEQVLKSEFLISIKFYLSKRRQQVLGRFLTPERSIYRFVKKNFLYPIIYTACPANGHPAWLNWHSKILGRKTTDRIHLKFLNRFSYILRRSILFVFKNYEKKWELPAKVMHFCAKMARKCSFVLYHNSNTILSLTKMKPLIVKSKLNLQFGINRSHSDLVKVVKSMIFRGLYKTLWVRYKIVSALSQYFVCGSRTIQYF